MTKKIINIVVIAVIGLFIMMTLSSFVGENEIQFQMKNLSFSDFFFENWALIGLVLSELAALLPAKPKGIIDAVLKLINQVVNKYQRPIKSK